MFNQKSLSPRRAYVAPGCEALEVLAGGNYLQSGSPIVGADGLQDANIVSGSDHGFDSWD